MQEKERLQRELEKAQAELAQLDRLLEHKADYAIGEGDPAIYNWEFNLAQRQRAARKVKSLEEALQKLGEGTYGMCERCHRKIDPERLKILPHTTLCIECARGGRPVNRK
jgi:RNA polymerase-binding protein DksA